jgi:hypothetical protein
VVERCPSVELIRIVEPLLRSRVIIAYSGERSEFPNSTTTVARVFEFSEKVDTVATTRVTEVVPKIVVHAERGFIGSTLPEW